jgi:hypothetical protein
MKLFLRMALLAATVALVAPASRAQVYFSFLSGANEAPPNNSPGFGFTTVIIDPVANTMRVQASFSNLFAQTAAGAASGTTSAHIHAPTPLPLEGTAGVATTTPTFPGFPVGVRSGSYDQTFNLLDAGTYNPAFVAANGGTLTGARDALLTGITSNRAYLNIHTNAVGPGEIRGFLVATNAPEPGSLALLAPAALPLIGGTLVARRRRRQRRAAA